MTELLFSFIFEILLYGTGKIVLLIISFGAWRADLNVMNPAKTMSLFHRHTDGKIYFSAGMTQAIGFLFWFVAGLIFLAVLKK